MLGLTDIELFLAFADSRNSIEAAERLGISQPTFSERLKSLEQSLPLSPFAWRGHKRILNSYGRRLADELRPRVAELRSAMRGIIEECDTRTPPRLRLSGRIEVLARFALSAGQKQRFILDPCSSPQALQKLLDGEIDIAITHSRPIQKDLLIQKLFEPSVAWICSPRMCPQELRAITTAKSSTPWKCSLNLPWISYREDCPLLNFFVERTGLSEVRDSVWLMVENWLVVRDLVMAGKGVAVVPWEALAVPEKNGLKRIDFARSDRDGSFYAVYRSELSHSTQGRELISTLKKTLHDVT